MELCQQYDFSYGAVQRGVESLQKEGLLIRSGRRIVVANNRMMPRGRTRIAVVLPEPELGVWPWSQWMGPGLFSMALLGIQEAALQRNCWLSLLHVDREEIKAEIGVKTRKAYREKDMAALACLAAQYRETAKRIGRFYERFREQWQPEKISRLVLQFIDNRIPFVPVQKEMMELQYLSNQLKDAGKDGMTAERLRGVRKQLLDITEEIVLACEKKEYSHYRQTWENARREAEQIFS